MFRFKRSTTKNPVEAHFNNIGFPFQIALCCCLIYRSIALEMFVEDDFEWPLATRIIFYIATAIVAYSFFRIYVLKPKTIITTGLFRYTRHPMYTGMLLLTVNAWWPTPVDFSVGYWTSLAVYVTSIFVAGYMQEKETLAKFGTEAEEYYRKTPRLFLWYPFMSR